MRYYYWNYVVATAIEFHLWNSNFSCCSFPIVLWTGIREQASNGTETNETKQTSIFTRGRPQRLIVDWIRTSNTPPDYISIASLHDCIPSIHTEPSNAERWTPNMNVIAKWVRWDSIVRWFVIHSEWIKWIEEFIDFCVVQSNQDPERVLAKPVRLWMCVFSDYLVDSMVVCGWPFQSGKCFEQWTELFREKKCESTTTWAPILQVHSFPFHPSMTIGWKYIDDTIVSILPFKKAIVRVAQIVNIMDGFDDGFESRTLTRPMHCQWPLHCGWLQLDLLDLLAQSFAHLMAI